MRKLLFLLQSIALTSCLHNGNDLIEAEVNGSITTANKVNWNKVNQSHIKCDTFDPDAFDHVLKNRKLAYRLAKKFAPILRFDKDVYDDYYPTSLKNIFKWSDPSSINCGGKLSTHDTDKHKGGKYFPTYYGVQENPYNKNRVFIDYWLVYIHQNSCLYTEVREFKIGEHDYDWEHIVVQANKTTDKVYSVTYFQHTGWYTRMFDDKHIEIEGKTHAVAYIGRLHHGIYHDAHKKAKRPKMCLYDGDSREPHDETIVKPYEEGHLKEMSSDAYGFGFNGDFGNGAGKGPLYRNRKYWEYQTCKDWCKANDYDESLQIGNIPD